MKHKINKGAIVEKINNKIVIFDSDKSIFFTFNETASFIFQKVKLGWEEKKIINLLSKKYHIDEKIIKKDVNFFLKMLLNKKIISSSSSKK